MKHQRRKLLKHGLRQTLTGNSHAAMMSRCFNETYNGYPPYGGRGITVCEFLKDPRNMVALIGERKSLDFSLDRKDNDGHYSCGTCRQCLQNKWPMNVRWATRREQGSNRRTNRRIVFGETYGTMIEISRKANVPVGRIWKRLKRGWSVDAAVLADPVDCRKSMCIGGIIKTMDEWENQSGIKKFTIKKRVQMGWPEDRWLSPINQQYSHPCPH